MASSGKLWLAFPGRQSPEASAPGERQLVSGGWWGRPCAGLDLAEGCALQGRALALHPPSFSCSARLSNRQNLPGELSLLGLRGEEVVEVPSSLCLLSPLGIPVTFTSLPLAYFIFFFTH